MHGKYVPPADLNGADYSGLVPDKVDFDILVNPLNYTKGNAGGQYNNTALKAAHVEVDLKTGETRVNGKRLDGPQEKIILDACRKAGIR